MLPGNCWLWPEAGGIRWWTPAASARLDLSQPGDTALASQIAEFRDGGLQVSLAEGLDPALAAVLTNLLQSHPEGMRLHLSRDLPPEWQRFPFAWLRWNGADVHGRLLVERYSPRPWQPPAAPGGKEIAVLDLWPAESDSSGVARFRGLGAIPHVQVYRGAGSAQHFLQQTDLTGHAVLCVIAHGSGDKDAPFRLPDGTHWSLPPAERLPPVVLLLVCGDDRQGLIEYGHSLLARGAQAVLAPIGRPDAGASEAFLRGFLSDWPAGRRLDQVVLSAQADPASLYGARSFELIGRGDLYAAGREAIEARPDGALAARAIGDPEALCTLIGRITLRCYQNQGDHEAAPRLLYGTLGIEYRDARWEVALVHTLDGVQDRLSLLSRAWVLPLIAYLAEDYDHSLLAKYEKLHAALRDQLPQSPVTHHAWSKLYFRQGRDVVAVEELVDGFRMLAGAEPTNPYALTLLSQLINILLDFDLPAQSQAAYGLFETALGGASNDFLEYHRRNRLDRAGRIQLRCGNAEAAAACFRLRRADSVRAGEDGSRDLAWLLYIAAWAGLKDAAGYADDVKRLVSNVETMLDALGPGKHSEAYLLKGLAVWAWRTGDPDAAALLRIYQPVLRERLYSQDPGPFGMTLGFMHLHALTHQGSSDNSWAEAREVLCRVRQAWLDAAVIDALAGDRLAATQGVDLFQTYRNRVIDRLDRLPDWVRFTVISGLAATETERERTEREMITHASPDAGKIVAAGLVPV